MTMSRKTAGAAVLALAAAAAGCASIGRPFPADQVRSIAAGKTTRDQVQAEYGRPYRTGLEDGDETWTYLDYKLSLFGPQRTRDLFVRFNADGTVKSYSFNSNE